MVSYRVKKPTWQECRSWLKESSVNPRTGRRIGYSGAIYAALSKACHSKSTYSKIGDKTELLMALIHRTPVENGLKILEDGKLLSKEHLRERSERKQEAKSGYGGSDKWVYLGGICAVDVHKDILRTELGLKMVLILSPNLLNGRTDWILNPDWNFGRIHKGSKIAKEVKAVDFVPSCIDKEFLFPDEIDLFRWLKYIAVKESERDAVLKLLPAKFHHLVVTSNNPGSWLSKVREEH